ncbi:hypothetical protein Pla108_39030 [Botrimarina colliarenosi]|uniref:BNR/Asp-box repeat protein n=1 Tax=Botrimarina colliarenosi TaxID=2528001 RepID=A0A5C6A1G3_9BACT|nr:BNR-4 repeat-containing protein [Botrimarina colliarenosi]TWT93409.1 hypothetical protein Pla108_39030 [Botrimarina colliarenosi]
MPVSQLQCLRFATAALVLALTRGGIASDNSGGHEINFVAGRLIELNDNGAWSWFMDNRAIVQGGKLVVGSIRSIGDFRSGRTDPNWGNVEIATLDLETLKVGRTVMHRQFEQDDHNNPAFLPIDGDRLLAVYTMHGQEVNIYVRHSEPHNPLSWSDALVVISPGQAGSFTKDSVTYSNLFRLSSGEIIDIYRGVGHDPNYMSSDDEGKTWRYRGRFLKGRDGYSPYLKYVQDGDRIHFVATEDHPRNFDNSLYHGYIEAGELHLSDGEAVGPMSDNQETALRTWDFTRVFQGDPDNVAWMCDIELNKERHPVIAFTVQKDGRGLPKRQGGEDHRFHYARWDGDGWRQSEIAFAGKRLYPSEDDYTGLAAIDPRDVNVVYISTNAHPKTGEPLISEADGKRHHELFRGRRPEVEGAPWKWTPITANSTADNLRPLIPPTTDGLTALVWMRGSYTHNRGDWTTAVVAMPLEAE